MGPIFVDTNYFSQTESKKYNIANTENCPFQFNPIFSPDLCMFWVIFTIKQNSLISFIRERSCTVVFWPRLIFIIKKLNPQ